MIIEKLDKQIEGLGVSMNEKFEELNRKISKLDSKFDNSSRRCQLRSIRLLMFQPVYH